ncbi:hypothetical protein A3E66_04765 [Candidatus Daviesbacteria bacterium RIFCSPHIGHO2_12_FULL_37_16]|uniref:Uncharacterized protein n=3 Tax=Candidatus Daviesiibacteriota TaxID=1752718 RepID=A0A0G0ETK0_9BACT|nr:MAG: hypothetical protein US19_C0018G0009 [Candidatus Daviesbacteria bacterium GW2011_GWB1_36_5]KKQ13883.1 MAG: hypothetical protein US28_C0043G0014 [Candidatus Daviesbacteria bacterium GW2011_GWA1_36_8]OGE34890.1 MAG: hypothetical protein A3E66_04765 [Candidatus Daviesbacteria bacterium RIFCSPHIGHO2_12_FULL_37_16]
MITKISNFKFQISNFLITPAFAASCPPEYQTDFGCLPQDNPAQFGAALYNIGLGFIGAVALLFIVYGGYLILTSQGNIEQLNKGKSYIFYSIVGIILAVAGYAFYQIVARDIIKIPGFTP